MNLRVTFFVAAALGAALLLASPAFAQPPQNSWAQSYGAASYDGASPTTDATIGSGYDVPAGVERMPDGGIVVAGQLDLPAAYGSNTGKSTQQLSNAAVVRYAPNGVILWQRLISQSVGYPSSTRVSHVRADGAGNVFVCGVLQSKEAGISRPEEPFVVKFDSNGALVWKNSLRGERWESSPGSFGTTDLNKVQAMTLLAGGGVAIGLEGYDAFNASTHAVLAQFDANGALSSYEALDDGKQYNQALAVAQRTGGGDPAILLTSYGDLVIKAGALQRGIPRAASEGEAGVDLIATADGGYLMLSYVDFHNQKIVLRKLSGDLSSEWEKIISRSASGTTALQPRSVSQAPDGSFLVSGQVNASGAQGAADAGLMKVSANGTLVAVTALGGKLGETVESHYATPYSKVIATADGGYAFVTDTRSYGASIAANKPDWWVVKTDSNRRVHEFDDIMTELPLSGFTAADVPPASSDSIPTYKSISGKTDPPRFTGEVLPGSIAFTASSLAHNTDPTAPQVRVQADNYFAPVLPSPSTLTITAPSPPTQGETWTFQVTQPSNALGLTVRVQRSATPWLESSWIDLPEGGLMTHQGGGVWTLATVYVPSGQQVRFRVICSVKSPTPKAASTVSEASTPFNIAAVPAPNVSISPPPRTSGGFGGSLDDARMVNAGTFTFGAMATTSRPVRSLSLAYDGATLDRFVNASGSVQYFTNVPGDHVLEAFAADDLGGIGSAAPVYIRIPPPFGKVFQLASSGDWNDAANWTDEQGNPGVPGPNDHAVVGSQNVSLAQDVTTSAVSLSGGSISGPAALTVTGSFAITTGQLKDMNLTIAETGTCLLLGDSDIRMSGNVTNRGKWKVLGGGGITGVPSGSSLARRAGGDTVVAREGFFDGIRAFFQNVGEFIFRPRPKPPVVVKPNPTPAPLPPVISLSALNQGGKLISNDGASLISNDGGSVISNDGGSLRRDGVPLISQDGGGLISQDGAGLISQDGAGLISQDGAGLISQDGAGVIAIAPNAASATHGRAAAAASSSAFVQTAGETNLGRGGSIIGILGDVRLDGGILSGSGVIEGTLTNASGFIAPGRSAGSILVDGDFAQGANGATQLEIGGPGEEAYDQLHIGGNAALDGRLIAKTINGYASGGEAFNGLTFGSRSGQFASVSSNAQVVFSDDAAAIQVSDANPPAAKLLNIATRMRVETGENALIAGFIITGAAPKKVIVRGLGPSIDVGGRLEDPTLELFQPDGSTVFNNNWRENEGEVQETTIPPPNDLESAIVATLEPGSYTAILRGFGDTTGVGLVEVYDLDGATPETLANISTRGQVQTGDNVMIGGLIIGGDQAAKVLIRAIGPSLEAAGVAGALQDPTLELVDGQGNIVSNDDWRETQEFDIIATTVPPANSREAAILALLPAGNYTAIVRGKSDTTGVALIEAYNLQ